MALRCCFRFLRGISCHALDMPGHSPQPVHLSSSNPSMTDMRCVSGTTRTETGATLAVEAQP